LIEGYVPPVEFVSIGFPANGTRQTLNVIRFAGLQRSGAAILDEIDEITTILSRKKSYEKPPYARVSERVRRRGEAVPGQEVETAQRQPWRGNTGEKKWIQNELQVVGGGYYEFRRE
jgi:hypothetical protein